MVHGECALGGRSDKKLVNITFHPYGPSANGRSSLHVDASIAALPGNVTHPASGRPVTSSQRDFPKRTVSIPM
jgi:hypothetical protein